MILYYFKSTLLALASDFRIRNVAKKYLFITRLLYLIDKMFIVL